jgi:hypothetical protein
MKWERMTIVLSCGCFGAGRWDDLWIGVEQDCSSHGVQTVARMSRVYEATPSRNFSLGVAETPEVSGEVSQSP